MKVVVTNGYVTVGSALYAKGEVIDLSPDLAKALISQGVAANTDAFLADAPEENKDEKKDSAPEEDGTSDEEDPDLAPAELPSVDPAAAAKKTRGKKR